MKNPTYYETVARNHARLAAMQDKRSADLFASAPAGAEDLTLCGELHRAGEHLAQKAALVHVDANQGEFSLPA